LDYDEGVDDYVWTVLAVEREVVCDQHLEISDGIYYIAYEKQAELYHDDWLEVLLLQQHHVNGKDGHDEKN